MSLQISSWCRGERAAKLLVAAALLLFTRPANAQRIEGVELVWRAQRKCGSKEGVFRRLRVALGPDWQSPTTVRAIVTVVPAGTSSRVSYEVEVDGARASRRLRVTSCEGAEVAAALFTLLAIDPGLTKKLNTDALHTEPVESAKPVERAPLRAEVGLPSGSAETAAARSDISPTDAEHLAWASKLGGFVALSGLVQPGATAGLGGGIEACIGAELSHFALLGRVHWLPKQSASVDGVTDARVDIELFGAGLDLRLLLSESGLRYGPYLGAEFNRVSAQAAGVSAPGRGESSWTAGGAGVWLEWPVSSWLSLVATGGVVLPFKRPVFSIEPLGPVYQPEAVQGKGTLGVFYHWGSRKGPAEAISN